MKDVEFKILDVLSREIGNPISIRQLNEKINSIHGSSHYPAIHSQIQELAKKKILNIDKYGKSSVASLNFDNPLLIDSITQTEIISKIQFLEERKDWQILVLQINAYLREFNIIRSVLTINPQRNAKLNRIELFILLRKKENKKESKDIHTKMKFLERKHNIRIDHFMLDEASFEDLLISEDANPIKEIMSDKIVIFHPQDFWFTIKNFLDKGIRIKVEEESIIPAKISEQDTVFNLVRFGYKEMGTRFTQGKPIGIEYIVTSILVKKDNIRRIEAIPIILAKNKEKINYSILIFLATKFKRIRQLYSLLKVLDEIIPTKEIKGIMQEIPDAVKQGIKTDQQIIKLRTKDMERKMSIYNVLE